MLLLVRRFQLERRELPEGSFLLPIIEPHMSQVLPVCHAKRWVLRLRVTVRVMSSPPSGMCQQWARLQGPALRLLRQGPGPLWEASPASAAGHGGLGHVQAPSRSRFPESGNGTAPRLAANREIPSRGLPSGFREYTARSWAGCYASHWEAWPRLPSRSVKCCFWSSIIEQDSGYLREYPQHSGPNTSPSD